MAERIDPAQSHVRMHEADETNLTWAGRRLLKPRYLDELPQLWNVFRGGMSLVGPRPWPPPMVSNQVAKGFTDRPSSLQVGPPSPGEKGVAETSSYAELDLASVEACRSSGVLRMPCDDLALLWRTLKVLAKGEGLRY